MLTRLKIFIGKGQAFSRIIRQPVQVRTFATMQKLGATSKGKGKRSAEASDEDGLLVFTTVKGSGSIKAQNAEDSSQGSAEGVPASSSRPSGSTSKHAKTASISSYFGRYASDKDRHDRRSDDNGTSVWWPARGLGPDSTCHMGTYRDPFGAALANTSANEQYKKVAAFDLDGTLIETKSGRIAYKFEDEYDFRVWGNSPKDRKEVTSRLRKESEDGSLVIIVTSQYNLMGERLKRWRRRLNHIMSALDVPAIIIASTGKDSYRKPNAGWIDHLRYLWRSKGGTIPLDVGLSESRISQIAPERRSFFVGDAAGRLASGSRREDFADTDRKLADNLSWQFYTPEELFLGHKPLQHRMSGYRPPTELQVGANRAKIEDVYQHSVELGSKQQTLLILVGPQASGKSRLAVKLQSSHNWVRVNQDLLKTRLKCVTVTKEALDDGKCVVIDNTNPTQEVRKIWTTLARDAGARIVCIHFDLTREEATHNDHYRSKRWLLSDEEPAASVSAPVPPKLPKPMPSVAFGTYFKTLAKPSKAEEDLDEVYTVGLEFEGSDVERRAWTMWYE